MVPPPAPPPAPSAPHPSSFGPEGASSDRLGAGPDAKPSAPPSSGITEQAPAWLRDLARDLPPDVRVPELRAMFRSASPRGIAWTTLVRRFGSHDATRVLAALQTYDLVEEADVDGRYPRTATALSWIESTMRTELAAHNVRAAVGALVQRARELSTRPGALLVPERVIACSDPPTEGPGRTKQADVHIVLVANEPAIALARAEALHSRTGAPRSRLDDTAWLASRRRATVGYLTGHTCMLRATASAESVPGTEIFPDGLTGWLEQGER